MVLAEVMDLRIAIRSDYFVAGIGLVLAKVMKVAKEIRPGYKKRVKTGVKTGVKTPINRRPGWVPGGSVVCWRLLAFLWAGDARREGTPPGLVVLSVVARAAGRWSAGDGWGGRWSGGNLRRQFGGI